MILDELTVGAERFALETGWELTAEGACHGDVCVPLAGLSIDPVAVGPVAERLGMALVHEPQGLWALGPASLGGRALASAQAPELELPDIEGRPFRLSGLRGRKVVLVAWSPY